MRSHRLLLMTLTAAVSACGTSATSAAATPASSVSPPTSPSTSATPAPPTLTSLTPPSARWGAAAAYDPTSHHLILFGGQSSPTVPTHNDTWSWDGARWQELHPRHVPPARAGAALVLDPVSKHLDLVGGAGERDSNGFPVQLGMWSWAGSDWSRVSDNPIQDDQVNAAADPTHGQVLLDSAGDTGAGPVPPPSTYVAGADVWNGSLWARASAHLTGTTTVMGSHDAGIAFDPLSNRVIEFGGAQQVTLGDTLAWDGTRWATVWAATTPPDTSQPPPGTASAATNSTNGHIILLAGAVDDARAASTWEWNGARWVRLRGTEPPLLNAPVIADDPAVGGVVLFGGIDTGTGSGPTNAMYVWRGDGWETLASPPIQG